MPRYVALLRAVNVGGRLLKMEVLRELLGGLGLTNVETFIASGNAIFDTPARDRAALEKQIGRQLKSALGYEVAVFLRTPAEMARIAAVQPFDADSAAAAPTFCVGFLAGPLSAGAREALLKLRSGLDDLYIEGREIYWLSRARQSESKFNNTVCERAIEARATFRGMSTVRTLAAKYPA